MARRPRRFPRGAPCFKGRRVSGNSVFCRLEPQALNLWMLASPVSCYRWPPCRYECRPLLDRLGAEPDRICGRTSLFYTVSNILAGFDSTVSAHVMRHYGCPVPTALSVARRSKVATPIFLCAAAWAQTRYGTCSPIWNGIGFGKVPAFQILLSSSKVLIKPLEEDFIRNVKPLRVLLVEPVVTQNRVSQNTPVIRRLLIHCRRCERTALYRRWQA